MRHRVWMLPLLLAACVNPGSQITPGVREADAASVAQCRHISNIRGIPSVYGPLLGGQGLSYTRNQVMTDAQAAGANTVVFDKVTPGQEVYVLRAATYRC